ncbi:FAD/NAD(P)-binding domain-containing protein [Sodiomyces alkalinus F11]|uniref:FAD/NAD(P)-binding domain-containing protein n=1 Tax=Sodiomyces alkalinus (strain CBS 110278 / VKM F-3762 / F11) TaxID=1314773 RepID=A0A3N2Q1G0_SODAK|nr:FAD/NAD(P)-binding domain-containing protein [Sodiomyces alkalinus F11]ROT40546.1 FAD/NAD(P)-binding domain-containing protein [Sodiomyces alkalinus F11]
MVKTVVVVGGSYGGLQVTHRLLKYTRQQVPDLKVILVSKTSHFFWNIASVRGIIPGHFKEEQLFQPIEPGLAQYPKDSNEFVLGTASNLDADARTLDVDTLTGPRTLSYDFLVLATGARSPSNDVPWKDTGNHEKTLATLRATSERVQSARHIVVVGAGPTGVEVSAEIAFHYGKEKEVILVSADQQVLGGDSLAAAAERELVNLGVVIRKGVKAETVSSLPNGRTEVNLSDGEILATDLYLSTVGLVPNSDYIDPGLLNERKYVVVDECLRVRGYENVWACGDLVSVPKASFPITNKQAAGVAKNVELALQGKRQQVAKGMPFDVLLCTTGPNRGVGRLGIVSTPSLAVWFIKGRTLATESLPKFVSGSQW